MTDKPNVPNPKHVNALLQDALEWLLENRPELLTAGDADPVETAAMKLGEDYMLVQGLDIREVEVVEGVVL